MSNYIVDASVAAKWFFEEAHTADAMRLLVNGHRLHAPDFLMMELDSVVCRRIRRNEIRENEGGKVRIALRRMPIQTHSFLSLLDPAYEIAIGTGRSIYDCLYVALAALLDGRMVTADRRLYDGLADGPFANHLTWVGEIA